MNKTLVSRIMKCLPALALVGGSLAGNQAHAAASLDNYLTNFEFGVPQELLVQSQAWYKPQFGNAGWTHFSKWGQIKLKRGQTVSITVKTNVAGFYPGLTVWQRPQGKGFAPSNWYSGHSYNQYASIDTWNQIDQNTGANLGRIKMDWVINGFDTDGMKGTPTWNAAAEYPSNPSFNGVSDGIPGSLTLTFKAKKSGLYQFVFAGINPDDKTATNPTDFSNNAKRHPVTVTVEKLLK